MPNHTGEITKNTMQPAHLAAVMCPTSNELNLHNSFSEKKMWTKYHRNTEQKPFTCQRSQNHKTKNSVHFFCRGLEPS